MSQYAPLEETDAAGLVLPEPTLENPLIQVDFLFNRLAELKPGTRTVLKTALSFYKRVYLAATHNYDPDLPSKRLFFVRAQWDSFALVKVQSFLEVHNVENNPRRLSSASVSNIVSALRQVMRYAALHQLTEGGHVFSTASAPVQRETTQQTAYSDQEMDTINRWLHSKLQQAHAAAQAPGYQRKGTGRDPRLRAPRGNSLSEESSAFGWKHLPNLRWYFENVMKCQASYKWVSSEHPHYSFYYHAARYYPGGYQGLFTDWRIRPVLTLDVLMPLAMKLCLETGLNTSSLWNLTADCFQEKHPLSGVPYIQYYKGRSQGHMELHLNLYDKDATICEFKEAQANVIRKTIARIRQVTDPLRGDAPDGCGNLLFLYQVSLKNRFGEVLRMHDRASSTWCLKQVEEAGLKADNENPLQLNMARFRSTKITDMVRRGVDFFEIQNQFGHQSILTTLKYIARNNLEFKARRDIYKAIQMIHDNQAWQQTVQPAYAGTQGAQPEAMIYKGILADCRNVFDPPQDVKKLKGYKPSQACTRYNMCLFCKNVVLMRHHLPMLVVYRRQIMQAMGNNTTELPNAHHYQRTLGIIDCVLDSVTSEFSPEDIAWANAAAECMDEFIDPVVYRPTLQA